MVNSLFSENKKFRELVENFSKQVFWYLISLLVRKCQLCQRIFVFFSFILFHSTSCSCTSCLSPVSCVESKKQSIMACSHAQRWVRGPLLGEITPDCTVTTVVLCRKFTLHRNGDRFLPLNDSSIHFWYRTPSPLQWNRVCEWAQF